MTDHHSNDSRKWLEWIGPLVSVVIALVASAFSGVLLYLAGGGIGGVVLGLLVGLLIGGFAGLVCGILVEEVTNSGFARVFWLYVVVPAVLVILVVGLWGIG